MPWLPPKTDWTENDYYNSGDLNRVEINTAHVATLLFLSLSTFINRTTKTIEFSDSMNRIEGNIKTIADNFYSPVGWEPPKLTWQAGIQGGGFSYADANRLEKNLLLLFDLVTRTIANYKYCGTFACGEDVIF